jgi:hypothetical protein
MWVVDTKPTLTSEGDCVRFCTVCLDYIYGAKIVSETKIIPPLNTTDYIYTITNVPTTTSEGSAKYTYTFSDRSTVSIEVTIPPVSDVHDPAPSKEDCITSESGDRIYYSYMCNHCNNWVIAYVDHVHTWGSWVIEINPTVDTAGL